MRDYAGFGYASLFGYVSFEPPRDYAGFGYASLLFRLCFVCLCCFGYVLIVGYVLCIISINDTILYKGYYL